MPRDYLLILILLLVAAGFAAANLVLSHLIGPKKRDRVKLEPYECGIDPVGNARGRISVRFYLVAMLFILFDLETVFTLPLGRGFPRPPAVWFSRDVHLYHDPVGLLPLCVEKGRPGMGIMFLRKSLLRAGARQPEGEEV